MSESITVSAITPTTTLDTAAGSRAFSEAVSRVVAQLQVGVIHGVLSLADSSNFPLPADPNAFARKAARYYSAATEAQRNQAISLATSISKNSTVRSVLVSGDLTNMDGERVQKIRNRMDPPATDHVSHNRTDPPATDHISHNARGGSHSLGRSSQMKAVWVPAIPPGPPGEVEPFDDALGGRPRPGPPPIPAPQPGPMNNLAFRVRRVRCDDQTDGIFGEAGEDEIYLGAVAIDTDGTVSKTPLFKVDDFEDGDVKNYQPPSRLAVFDLRKNNQWPKEYSVVLAFGEASENNEMAMYLTEIFNAANDFLQEQIRKAGDAIGGWLGGPLGAAIGMMVAAALNKILREFFDWLIRGLQDKIFPPITLMVRIPSSDFRWRNNLNDPGAVIYTGFDGQYTVQCDWAFVP